MNREEQINRIADYVIAKVASIRADDNVKILGLLTALQSYMTHVTACKEPAMGFALVEVSARSMRESITADKPKMPWIDCPLCQRRIQFGTCEHDLSAEVDNVEYGDPPTIIVTSAGPS